MIYIVAGNLKQAYQCATKERLHMDLWVSAQNFNNVTEAFKPGDKLWITGDILVAPYLAIDKGMGNS